MLSLRHRFLLLLALVLLSQTVREWYPFSHYPMYSAFPDRSSYIYVRKANGEPLATQRDLRSHSSTIKKIFKSHVGRYEGDSAAAGLATLEQLVPKYRGEGDPRTFELVWVDVTVHDGRITERPTVHGPLVSPGQDAAMPGQQ